jgi:magnesium chelatase family protein
MLARRCPTILSAMTLTEALEPTRIHRVADLTGDCTAFVTTRPFRVPHPLHGGGLIGGGQAPLPGEVSLAPHGIFFPAELPECTRHMLEVLRQPLAAAPPPLTPAPVPVNVACFSLDAGQGLEY